MLEEEDPYLKGNDREGFKFEDFLTQWHAYAAKLKTEGKANLLSIFITNPPVMISPFEFEITVDNKIQESIFRAERPALLNYLRSTLKNFSIEVGVKVEESTAAKRPYTNQEKFQHMAAKNPQLVELRKRFNLDFD